MTTPQPCDILRAMGDVTFAVGFSGVGRAGFDRRDHTAWTPAKLVFAGGRMSFVPSRLLRLTVEAFTVTPSDVDLRLVNIQGSRYWRLKPDQSRPGLALLRAQPTAPLVLWPRSTDHGLAIVEAARAHGFHIEDRAQSLPYAQIDVLHR
jgi:hypothetical protein